MNTFNMQEVNAIFLKAQEPLEEKELESYIVGNTAPHDQIQFIMAIKQLRSKVIDDVEVFYPTRIFDNRMLDYSDSKHTINLQKQLVAISKIPKFNDYKERLQSLEKLRNKMVVELWKKKGGDLPESVKTFSHKVAIHTKTDNKVAELQQAKIKALHEFNDVKDAAYNLFGILANVNQCTVRDVFHTLSNS